MNFPKMYVFLGPIDLGACRVGSQGGEVKFKVAIFLVAVSWLDPDTSQISAHIKLSPSSYPEPFRLRDLTSEKGLGTKLHMLPLCLK